uniref:Uncharacterized protein n=1 Tax=Panagrolaimus sp. PS1159 TaxID=55785 RepID=A0AC35GG30_9BILA
MVNGVYKVITFLYEKCGDVELSYYYASGIIEGTELSFEYTGRVCFKDNEPPFRPHGTNIADNVMELKISPGAFGCQVFLILVILFFIMCTNSYAHFIFCLDICKLKMVHYQKLK